MNFIFFGVVNMPESNHIKNILTYNELGRDKLLNLLKTESKQINIQDIMQACLFLIKDSVYVQENYRRLMLEAYTSGFIIRIKEVKEHNLKENGLIDIDEIKEAVDLLIT